MTLPRTPSQTIGPYLSIAMRWPADGRYVVPDGTPDATWIRGRLLDGAGPVDDAVVETWQADAGFRGFGRVMTEPEGRWAIHTIKPGRVVTTTGRASAPHIDVAVFARGLLKPVWTRIYFGDEGEANEADEDLQSIDVARRRTLMAVPTDDGYRFDIHLQGADETVFFDV